MKQFLAPAQLELLKLLKKRVQKLKQKENHKNWYIKNKIKKLNSNKKWKLKNKEKVKSQRRQHYLNNIEKVSNQNKLWKQQNHITYKQKNKEYYQKNKLKINKQILFKLQTEPFFKIIFNLRKRIRASFKVKKWQKTNSIRQIIGCEYSYLIQHFEQKFQPGMTWENQGKWHVDHIIPLSSAKTKEELYQLCHYTNLQPLWAIDNLRKGAKIEAK